MRKSNSDKQFPINASPDPAEAATERACFAWAINELNYAGWEMHELYKSLTTRQKNRLANIHDSCHRARKLMKRGIEITKTKQANPDA